MCVCVCVQKMRIEVEETKYRLEMPEKFDKQVWTLTEHERNLQSFSLILCNFRLNLIAK